MLSALSLMETPGRNLALLLLLVCVPSSFSVIAIAFSPTDNYLIDCGSTVDATVDNRLFVSDSSSSNPRLWTFSARSKSIELSRQNGKLPQIYHSARVFFRPSTYTFKMRDKGIHMVRLHFNQLNSSNFVSDAQFHVLVNGYVVLSNFSGGNVISNATVKEYLIWVDSGKLVIKFVPAQKSKSAFVNAIEVISAPKDLILDTAQFVKGDNIENFDELDKQALEVMFRVNVGGPKVTPFNDTLWRTWLPDDDFFKSSDGSNKVYSTGRIRYQSGGASRETGPDNVYNTARVIASSDASIPNLNMTWEFPVLEGYKYLVRLHFCDIASISLGLLFFNVYVHGNLAYKDLDPSHITGYSLSSPFYLDFVVDGDHSGVLSISVGPSDKSMSHAVDGILNAVEIMKMNKSMGILDGEHCAGVILNAWSRSNVSIVVPLIAAVCVLLSLSVFKHSGIFGSKNSVTWSKLPGDGSEVTSKHRYQIV